MEEEGISTSTLPPYHLLRLQAIHQQLHCYVPHHNFVIRVYNGITDRLSQSRYIVDANLIAHMESLHTKEPPWRLWTPLSELVSAISSTLQCTTYPRNSLLVKLPPPMDTGKSEMISVETWNSTPYLSHTRIRCLSSTPPRGITGHDTLPQVNVKYDPTRLRTPYGKLARGFLI